MAIDVRIPTILRTYTDGERSVAGVGATIGEIIDNLDSAHDGIGERILQDGEVRRFINIYVNDEDIRFAGGLGAAVSDGDTIVILPAVAGGAA